MYSSGNNESTQRYDVVRMSVNQLKYFVPYSILVYYIYAPTRDEKADVEKSYVLSSLPRWVRGKLKEL